MARGQIIPRGKASFRVMVYAGRDPVTRKERRLTGTARSRRDAEKLLTRLLSQLDEQRQPATGPPSATCSTAGSRPQTLS